MTDHEKELYRQMQKEERNDESGFIDLLNSMKNVKWWFKNGDRGHEYIAVRYFDEEVKDYSFFYPEWLVQMKDGRLGIFAMLMNDAKRKLSTKNQAMALAKRIEEMNAFAHADLFFGGFVINDKDTWYYSDSAWYQSYDENPDSWKPFVGV